MNQESPTSTTQTMDPSADVGSTDLVRLSDMAYLKLMDSILSGDLKPGRQISELELTRQLKVSRTPVHEAIGQLIKDGLVIQRPNRRPVIAEFSIDDVTDIFEMRCLLESEAAAKAATRMDRPTIAHLRNLAGNVREALETPEVSSLWGHFDDEFHIVIAKASGSKRLEEDITRYRRLNRVFSRMPSEASVIGPALDENLEILKAIEDREPELARQKMQRHLEEWQRFFVQRLSK